jgi:hypothetical protein
LATIDVVRRVRIEGSAPGVAEAERTLRLFGSTVRTTATAFTGAAAAIGAGAAGMGVNFQAASRAGWEMGRVLTPIFLRLGTVAATAAASIGFNSARIVLGITAVQRALLAMAAVRVAGGVFEAARAETERLAEIGRGADRAGFSTSIFQTFTAQARVLRLEVSDLQEALTSFRDNARETMSSPVSTVRGRLADLAGFDRGNDPTMQAGLARYEAANGRAEQLRVVLDLMRQLEAEGRRLQALDIAETAFGSGRLVERLREGTITLEQFGREALRTNEQTAPAETIRRVEQLNERYEAAHRTLSEAVRPVLIDLVNIGVGINGWAVTFVELMARAAGHASSVYTHIRGVAGLPSAFAAPAATDAEGRAREIQAIERRIQMRTARLGVGGGAQVEAQNANIREEVSDLVSDLLERRRAEALRLRVNPADPAPATTGGERIPLPPEMDFREMARIRDRFERQRNASSSGSEMDAFTRSMETQRGRTAALREEIALVGQASGAIEGMRVRIELETVARRQGMTLTAEQTAAIQREAAARREAAAALATARMQGEITFERGLIGLSDGDMRIATRLREIYGNDIPAAMASSEAAAMRLNDALRQTRDMGSEFFGSVARGLAEGGKPLDVLSKGLSRIGSQLVEMAAQRLWQNAFGSMFGGGSGAGLLGGLFGGGTPSIPTSLYASGGYTGPGGRLDPAGIVHRGEYVFSAPAVSRAGIGALDVLHRSLKGYADGGFVGAMPAMAEAGGAPISIVTHIDARGADSAAVARLEAGLARRDARLKADVIATVREARASRQLP